MRQVVMVAAMVMGYVLTTQAQVQGDLELAKIADREKMELINYEKACKTGTLDALTDYVSLYPNGKYTNDAKMRIADHDVWLKACVANTIGDYETYLRTSELQAFAEAAKDSISELTSIAVWDSIKTDASLTKIDGFLKKYPHSSRSSEAIRLSHELTAVSLYDEGQYNTAFDEFVAAGGRSKLSGENALKYDECVEMIDYHEANDIVSMVTFLRRHSKSKYRNNVSNKLAVLKAQQLDYKSEESDCNDALSYATDEETKNIVAKYIAAAHRQRIEYERHLRNQRIMANGGYIMFGIEAGDLVLGCADDGNDVFSYNVGASIKFGNYKAPLQLELGIKPGVICWYSDVDDYQETRFHMPIYAKLKLNLANMGKPCKFYVAGMGFYNAIRDKDLESEFSLGGGLGLAWKKIDLFLYYKHDIEEQGQFDWNIGGDYCGISLVLYL